MDFFVDLFKNHSEEFVTLMITMFCAVAPMPFMLRKLVDRYKTLTDEKYDCGESKIELLENKLKELEKEPTTKFDVDTIRKFLDEFDTSDIVDTAYVYCKNPTLEELYKKRNTDNFLKTVSFTLAVIMSIIGTIILFVGIIASFFSTKNVGWITTSSGAIIEVVAGIYFWLLNRTMKEVKDNSRQLEKTENLITAMELVEKITNTTEKDNDYKNMIDNLISIK